MSDIRPPADEIVEIDGVKYLTVGGKRYQLQEVVEEEKVESAPPSKKGKPSPQSVSVDSPAARSITPSTQRVPDASAEPAPSRSPPSPAKPTGEALKLEAGDIFEWLKIRMINKEYRPTTRKEVNFLGAGELKYSLQKREKAMEYGEYLFQRIFNAKKNKVRNRESYIMPVCAAMSGIGKSRILQEWWMRLHNEAYSISGVEHFPPASQRMGFIMSYGNGRSVRREERSMSSEAAFSWRLLYAVFLESNRQRTAAWGDFWSNLPENAEDIKLSVALDVISSSLNLRNLDGKEDECFVLFLGIDEYQMIPQNPADGSYPLKSLLETLVTQMIDTSSRLVILPMFAGTNWGKMSVASSASSGSIGASVSTDRLSLPLLDQKAMTEAVLARGDGTEELLGQQVFCENLFYLGGVPRPCTQYTERCLDWRRRNPSSAPGAAPEKYQEFFETTFERFFDGVYLKAPRQHPRQNTEFEEKSGFSLREMIHLVAFALQGLSIDERKKPFESIEDSNHQHLHFGRLRDGSVCVLDEQVQVPYCFFYHLTSDAYARHDWESFPESEKAFMEVLRVLRKRVDHNVFHPSNAPWQQWELFGACFAALRINAILITSGSEEHLLSRVFIGARYSFEVDHNVRLRPMRVVQATEQLDTSTGVLVRIEQEPNPINWVKDGVVVVNSDNGKGIDIFYTLELAKDAGNYILVADQRKRVHGSLGVEGCIKNARIVPGPAQQNVGVKKVIVALFSMFTNVGDESELPPDSIAVTLSEHVAYHGSLSQHPASSSCVRVNVDGVTALRGLFRSRKKDGARLIFNARERQRITSFNSLTSLLDQYSQDLWPNAESQCIFSF